MMDQVVPFQDSASGTDGLKPLDPTAMQLELETQVTASRLESFDPVGLGVGTINH
jgi:hypothetical protein